MKVRLYNNNGFIKEREVAINYLPFAIYCDGSFYLHLTGGYYSPCPHYSIPPTPIEEGS